jgi:hypothetical protein
MVYIPNSSYAATPPTPGTPSVGTVLQVIGAPMLGFVHEFIRKYDITQDDPSITLIGKIEAEHLRDPPFAEVERSDTAYDANSLEWDCVEDRSSEENGELPRSR